MARRDPRGLGLRADRPPDARSRRPRSCAGWPRPRAATAGAWSSGCASSDIDRPGTRQRARAAVAAPAGPDRSRRSAAGRARGGRGRRGRRPLQALDRRPRRPTRCCATSARRSARTRWPSQEMRAGGSDGGGQDGRRGVDARLAVPGAQARLDRILGREKWHRTGGGWISGAIYGANDGLAAVFGIVAGVSGATGGSSFVLTAGLSGAIASALSMATGAFLAERSEAEVAGGQRRARAPGDRRASRGGEGGAVALLPAQGDRRAHRRRARRAHVTASRRDAAGARRSRSSAPRRRRR